MVLRYTEYCMLYYGILKVILNDVYDVETVVGAKSRL